MKLEITALGQEIVSRELLRMAGRADDLTPAMDAILEDLFRSTGEQFDSEGGYGSGGWDALAESTRERKSRLGLDPRILHATLDLRNSLTSEGGDNIAVPRSDGLDFGTTVDYAQYHVKSRPPVQPPEQDRRTWVKILQQFLVEGDPGRGGGGLLADVL